MPDERDQLIKQNDETEDDDVEAHRVLKNDEPDADDEDVEAHRVL